MNDPVLITGFARSKTSWVAKTVQDAGFFGGDTVGPDINNRFGYFENRKLRRDVTKPMLAHWGCDPLGIRQLPEGQPSAPNIRALVLLKLRSDGHQGEPWYFKDCKLALQWWVWAKAFPNATWVIVERDIEEIIVSCLRTSFMAQHSTDADFWHRKVSEYRSRFEEIRNNCNTITVTAPDGLDELITNLKTKE